MKSIDSLKTGCIDFVKFASSFQSLFLLAVRLFWGYFFLKSGLGKIGNIDSVATYLASLGIPFPDLSAYLISWTETIGGACLILGFASRLVSLPLIFAMLVALFTAHFDTVKETLNNPSIIVKESPFTYLLAALIIFVFGPGKISLDYFFEKLTKSKID